ncbi:Alkaline phosphatase D [Cocos nucifera]|nr:Alkaline phosphatase D [Cocos nucifera]
MAASPCGASERIISRIAFGSCANQSAPQPIWNAIIDFDPQLFIWLGDNIYGDNKHPSKLFGKERTIGPWKNVERFFPATEQEMLKRYEMAKNNPGYSKLRQSAQVIGTWDDHDYGLNDAGKEFSGKDTSQRLLLDFLDEPQESPRRKQAGVYASYLFGPKGKQVKVILLDTRYHRDPVFSDGTILGEAQWRWLEAEIKGPESEVTILASSIQVTALFILQAEWSYKVISNLSATTGPMFYMESWGRFPKERLRLYKLINDSKRHGLFFISGDIHFGEISRYDCGCRYSLYDITSSGLTQAVEKAVPPPLAFVVRMVAWLTPSRPNFGAIEIDWDAVPQRIKVELRDETGDPVTGVDFLLSELHPRSMNMTYREKGGYQHHCSLEIDLPWILRYRLAFVFFGTISVLVAAAALLAYIIVSISMKFIPKNILF